MMTHEGIHFQLIDLPAVSPEHPVPWLANTLQTADACLFIVALSDPACLEEVEAAHAVLRERRVSLSEVWPFGTEVTESAAARDEDPFALRLPTLLLANKADRLTDPASELRAFLELSPIRFPALAVSAVRGAGLGEIGPWLFRHLGIVRVYTKAPGRHPTGATRSLCGGGRRSRTWRGSSTRTSRGHFAMRGCGAPRDSRASSWVASIPWRTETWSSFTPNQPTGRDRDWSAAGADGPRGRADGGGRSLYPSMPTRAQAAVLAWSCPSARSPARCRARVTSRMWRRASPSGPRTVTVAESSSATTGGAAA
jgi:hypothetical protein